jgi:glutamate-1-semialdehyde 2,1-aminomutase
LTYGAPNEAETEMAEFIVKHIPSIEKVRMVSSGTEATMSAARLARGYTKKDIIIKFNGCYHGHGDAFLVEAGSGATTFGKPSSSGVTKGSSKDTISLMYNDKDQIKKTFSKYKNKIACVIIEPIAGNMNFVRADKSFLSLVRNLCTQNNSLLIFDEVMTGFRVQFQRCTTLL